MVIIANAEDEDATNESTKSGINYYEYYVNGKKQESNEIIEPTSGVTYTIYVIAYDKAGNSKQSEEQTIKITKKIAKISAGIQHNLAIDEEGNLWAWGVNYYGELGDGTTTVRRVPIQIKNGTKFKEIAAGHGSISFGIDIEGNLWGCGKNSYGELGNGTTTTRTTFVAIKPETKFNKVITGGSYNVGRTHDGYR